MKLIQYCVCRHNYTENEATIPTTVSVFYDLDNAKTKIEEILDDIQVDIQGDKTYEKSSDINAINSLSYGMFVLEHSKKCMYTVYRRTREALVLKRFNYIDTMICDLLIIRNPTIWIPELEDVDEEWKYVFDTVLNELVDIFKEHERTLCLVSEMTDENKKKFNDVLKQLIEGRNANTAI